MNDCGRARTGRQINESHWLMAASRGPTIDSRETLVGQLAAHMSAITAVPYIASGNFAGLLGSDSIGARAKHIIDSGK
jgi:hypothetical protein